MLFFSRSGTYNANVPPGFYEQAVGLGLKPDDENSKDVVSVNADWIGGMRLKNFSMVLRMWDFSRSANTVVDQTPTVEEEPFLSMDASGTYRFFVSALRTNVQEASWASGSPAGTLAPMSTCIIAKPGDTADSLQSVLAQGRH